jgi:hypothetical protein
MASAASYHEVPSDDPPTTFRYFNFSDSESSLSLTSSTTQSSLYTTTSSSTVPGPGAISGKAILLFGKMVLRGAESVFIRTRLNSMTHLFPHEDEAIDGNFEHIYDDVLELTRCASSGLSLWISNSCFCLKT